MTEKVTSDKLSLDSQTIRELAEILVDTDLSEIEYENQGKRIRVARNITMMASVPTMAAPLATPASMPVAASIVPGQDNSAFKVAEENAVKSPMVGTVYVAPSPDAPSFIKIGDMVTQGQTLLIIEAMKVMNPIKAPRAGKVTHIYVQDKQPVEYGEPLVSID